MHNISTKLLWT